MYSHLRGWLKLKQTFWESRHEKVTVGLDLQHFLPPKKHRQVERWFFDTWGTIHGWDNQCSLLGVSRQGYIAEKTVCYHPPCPRAKWLKPNKGPYCALLIIIVLNPTCAQSSASLKLSIHPGRERTWRAQKCGDNMHQKSPKKTALVAPWLQASPWWCPELFRLLPREWLWCSNPDSDIQ